MRHVSEVIKEWGYPLAQIPNEELALEFEEWKGEIQKDCSTIDKVAEFHRMTNCPILETPTIPDADRCLLRINLLREELRELEVALSDGNLIEVADALTDLQYVLDGAYLEFGMGSIKQALFDEVQRSNMSKACTEETINAELVKKQSEGIECTWSEINGQYIIVRMYDGKILKPSTYSPANLSPIVFPE